LALKVSEYVDWIREKANLKEEEEEKSSEEEFSLTDSQLADDEEAFPWRPFGGKKANK